MDLVIENEEQAWEVLKRATAGEVFPDDVQLVFKGWPVYKMNVKGRDWDSTVPTRIMAPMLEVQKDIHRAYASVRYGEDNLRRLRNEERESLEVVVKVREGSSQFDADLWQQLAAVAQAAVGRMNGTEIVITVLGLGMLLTAPVLYKAWLSGRQRDKELDHQHAMSQLENERLKIFSEAVQRQPILESARDDAAATHNRMLKVARPGDVVAVRNVAVSAQDAEVLAQPERERAEDIVIDGVFAVLGNRTDRSEGFRVTLRRLSDGAVFNADVPIELPHDQQQLIQDAEWGKKTVLLSMNASLLRGAVSQASVFSAQPVPPPAAANNAANP